MKQHYTGKWAGYYFLYTGGYAMKAGIIFSGSSPLLILTSYSSFTDAKFVEKLKTKGV